MCFVDSGPLFKNKKHIRKWVLLVLRWLFILAAKRQSEAKVVVAATGSFHSGFPLCKHHWTKVDEPIDCLNE